MYANILFLPMTNKYRISTKSKVKSTYRFASIHLKKKHLLQIKTQSISLPIKYDIGIRTRYIDYYNSYASIECTQIKTEFLF